MKHLIGILFTFITCAVLRSQDVTINQNHGFYYLIPNNIQYDPFYYDLLFDEDLRKDSAAGRFYVKEGHENVKIKLRDKTTKRLTVFSFPVQKPKLLSITLGYKKANQIYPANTFSIHDQITLNFDVDSFAGISWRQVMGCTIQISGSVGIRQFNCRSELDFIALIIEEVKGAGKLAITDISFSSNNVILPVSCIIHINEYLHPMGTEVFDAHIFPLNTIPKADELVVVKNGSSHTVDLRHLPVMLKPEYFSDCTWKLYKRYERSDSSKYYRGMIELHDSFHYTIHSIRQSKMFNVLEFANGNVVYTSQRTLKDILIIYCHARKSDSSHTSRVSETLVQEFKTLGKTGDRIKNELEKLMNAGLTIDSFVWLGKNKPILSAAFLLRRADPCELTDCLLFSNLWEQYLKSPIIVHDPQKLARLNKALR